MLDDKLSGDCKRILTVLNENNEIIKKVIKVKDEKIASLTNALDLSESRRQTAENMLAQIKEDVNLEIRKAYQSGYDAAFNSNPTGGTTVSQDQNKTLTLTNQS